MIKYECCTIKGVLWWYKKYVAHVSEIPALSR